MKIIRYNSIFENEVLKFVYKSPIGSIVVESTKDYIVRLYFSEHINFSCNKDYYLPIIKKLFLELEEYFSNKRKIFSINIGLNVTDFQYNVLLETIKIPFGSISTYSDISKKFSNNSFMSRAVGRVESINPIAILIPCHRVISKNMNLTGYLYGLEKKEYLLSLEGVNIFNKKVVL